MVVDMPLTVKSKFPVVDADPDCLRTMGKFSHGDLFSMVSVSGAGYLTGFFGCE